MGELKDYTGPGVWRVKAEGLKILRKEGEYNHIDLPANSKDDAISHLSPLEGITSAEILTTNVAITKKAAEQVTKYFL